MTDDTQDPMRRALALHQRGMLAEAETTYREILQANPNNVAALHMMGVVALQTGRPEQGVELIGKALRLNDRGAAAHNDLGVGFQALRRYDEALASYDRAIAL